MSVALVASSTSGTTDTQSSSKTCPVPAGAAATHVAVLAIEIWLDTSTDPVITWPSGFTQIGYVESTTDGFQRLYVALKVLTGADSGTYSMSWSGSYWNQAQCTLWSGVDNTTALDVAVATAVTAANTTMPAVSLTTAHAGCGMVHLVANENSATGTAPTGYTELQDANYLRTNTKVAGAAGSETPASGSISVSTVKLAALVALRPAAGGGGGTTAAGQAAETDTAQPAGRIRTSTAGQAAETDVAQPAGRVRTTAAGVALETDTAIGAARSRTTAAGTSGETDAALGAGSIRTTTAGTAGETDTALPASSPGAHFTAAGVALEVDTAQPAGRIRTTVAGTAVETDTALSAARTRVTTAGTAVETDSAQTAGRTRVTLAGVALEVDTAVGAINPNEILRDLIWTTYVEPDRYDVTVEPDRWSSSVEPDRWTTEVETV